MQAKLLSTGLVGAVLAAGIAALTASGQAQGQAETSSPATHLFVKRANAETLEPSATSVSRVMLTADQTNGRYSVIDETFQPGMKSPPHRHAYHSETFIVLAGKLRWTIAGETDVIGPGDLVYIPPDTSHWTEVVGDEPVHAIMLYEPGGFEIGLRLRAAARREGQTGGPAGAPRTPNPFADFIPDSRAGE
ncbi:MAG: cupin domain-containing protein [Gammaproteobacteria bacterium]|nr:cupin domain-containing protein [Gammaproteobacteria bacterium]